MSFSNSPILTTAPDERQPDTILVFGGGNALGAYQAGAFEVLHERGYRPQHLVGASVGAVNAAIIAGNPPAERISKLRTYWEEAASKTTDPALLPKQGYWRQVYNFAASVQAMALGRPSLYAPRFPGLWSALPGVPNDIALFDQTPLRRTLERLVDFDLLARAEMKLTVAMTDVESGDEVFVSNTDSRIEPAHLLASTAFIPAFPPVEIDGRLLCDPGLTNNLPVDRVLNEPPARDTICFALDLFDRRDARPRSLDATVERAQDLMFACQSRRTIEHLLRLYELREQNGPATTTAVLVHLAYRAGADELGTKMFEFSPASIRDRWAVGGRDMEAALQDLVTDLPKWGRSLIYRGPVRAEHKPAIAA
jgi:NTE family protein